MAAYFVSRIGGGAMTLTSWTRAPGYAGAERWLTRTGCRTVLVVVPHMTAGTRLVEVLPLLEADHRVHVVFTVPALADTWHGVEEYVRGWGGLVLPWHQVLRMRFDLALASSFLEIDKLDAPVMVLPHGIGGPRSRMSPLPAAGSGQMRDLVIRDGRVVPAAVVLAHDGHARRLAAECPEVASRVVVAGDICYDRLRASLPFRTRYRDALDVDDDGKLVFVTSTWSKHSLFGSNAELINQLATESLATRYRVVAALHPLVWSAHGAWQIRAWLAAGLAAGLRLLPPDDGWRAGLVAADCVIGDHGSVTHYAAALDLPVLLNPDSARDVRPGSPAENLWRLAPTIEPHSPARVQVNTAIEDHVPDRYRGLASQLTSAPGRSGALLRKAMYRILGIPEPARRIPVVPVPLP